MQILRLAGSPTEMGGAFGESCRDAIQELYTLRLENALAQAKLYGARRVDEAQLLDLARACEDPCRRHDPDGFAELCAIADGAALARERVMAMNGLTDLRDGLAWGGPLEGAGGCSSFVVQRDATRGGEVLCGQTWDLTSDNMAFVVGVERRPDDAPATWCVTTVGCLSLMGLNEAGIAIGTTNLRTLDARAGVPYLSTIHRALACRDFDTAVAEIERTPRAGGHWFYVASADGRAAGLECSAEGAARIPIAEGFAVHCNHCLSPRCAEVEADTPRASSTARQARLEALLEGAQGTLDVATLRGFLADHRGGELAICRHDYAGISTNAAIVMSPERRFAVACQGLPCGAEWVALAGA